MSSRKVSRRQVVTGLVATPVALSIGQQVGHAAPRGSAGPAAAASRTQIDLNRGWRFSLGTAPGVQERPLDDVGESGVDVPHTWNAQDGQDGAPPDSDGDYFRGEGWYRRDLHVPADLAGKRLFLEFDGANTTTDVWVDDVHLGQHKGGYGRFRFDATDALRAGDHHQLVVRVSNADDPDVAPLSADFTFFGGLYRGVNLLATEPVHVDLLDYAGPGVYLRQRSLDSSSALVEATTKLANDSAAERRIQLRTVVTDADQQVVQDVTSAPIALAAGARSQQTEPLRIAAPRLWRGRTDPHLYRVAVEVLDAGSGEHLDTVVQPLGLRSFEVRANGGLFLNGEHLQLRGVSRHQDRQDRGWAISGGDHQQDFALMTEMGVNALRTAHYQQDRKVVELADDLGMVVYTEVPLVNEITDSDAFRTNIQQQMREMIRQNYNHPSVLIWGIGNEQGMVGEGQDEQTNALLAELAGIVRTEDPERLSSYANVGKRADDDEFTSHADLSGYNRYAGWYHGTADDFGQWADSLHTRNPDRMIAVTEYGAGANIHQHEEPALSSPPEPDGPWHPEEYQSVFHESYLQQINARPYLWGAFVWNMFDFASDGREEGGQRGINDKGLVTHDRAVKKDAFFWYKANWANEPVLHITSRRWTERTEPSTVVRVYSNAESVTLMLNGERVGAKTGDPRLFTWPVQLAPGRNTVTAEAVINGETHADTVTWHLTA